MFYRCTRRKPPNLFFQSRVISCFPNFLMSGQLAGRIISGIKSLNARVKCVVFQPFMSVLPCFSRFFFGIFEEMLHGPPSRGEFNLWGKSK